MHSHLLTHLSTAISLGLQILHGYIEFADEICLQVSSPCIVDKQSRWMVQNQLHIHSEPCHVHAKLPVWVPIGKPASDHPVLQDWRLITEFANQTHRPDGNFFGVTHLENMRSETHLNEIWMNISEVNWFISIKLNWKIWVWNIWHIFCLGTSETAMQSKLDLFDLWRQGIPNCGMNCKHINSLATGRFDYTL